MHSSHCTVISHHICRGRYFHEEFTDPLLVAINEYRQTGQPAAAAAAANAKVAVTYSNRWLDRLTRAWLGGSIRDIENFESTVATRSTGEALQYRDVPSDAPTPKAPSLEMEVMVIFLHWARAIASCPSRPPSPPSPPYFILYLHTCSQRISHRNRDLVPSIVRRLSRSPKSNSATAGKAACRERFLV
jgi:hypothetical protein